MAASWGAMLIGGPINAAGSSPGGTATGQPVDCPGGLMVIAVAASAWNGATASLQMLLPDGQTLINVSPSQAIFTANGVGTVNLPPCTIQMTISGGTPTAMFASIARVVG